MPEDYEYRAIPLSEDEIRDRDAAISALVTGKGSEQLGETIHRFLESRGRKYREQALEEELLKKNQPISS